MDAIFFPYCCGTVSDWLLKIVAVVNLVTLKFSNMRHASFWIPLHFLSSPFLSKYTLCMKLLSSGWIYSTHVYNSASYGDCVSAHRIYFQVFKFTEAGTENSGKCEIPSTPMDCGYNKYINVSHSDKLQDISI